MKLKWTLQKLKKEALKYTTKSEFSKGSPGAYARAHKHGLLDQICKHMKSLFTYWTFESLQEEALKYCSKQEFRTKSLGAYSCAHKRGLIAKICQHMEPLRTSWTYKMLRKEALKYKTRGEFQNKSESAYQIAYGRGILDEICSHMTARCQPWTIETLLIESLKYNTRGEFDKKSPNAYNMARRYGIVDEICYHMPIHVGCLKGSRAVFKRTDAMLREEALKYTSRSEFKKNCPGAHRACIRRDILDSACLHMKPLPFRSNMEIGLLDEIKKLYPSATSFMDRKVKIKNKPYIKGFQIDVFIPELSKGIEFDGTYWHSIEGLRNSRKKWPNKDLKNYHQIKDKYFLSKGIKIIHITEKEWESNQAQSLKKALLFLKG